MRRPRRAVVVDDQRLLADAQVAEATVRSQVRGVLTKLGVGSQLEAVAQAHRSGWLRVSPSAS